MAMLLPFPRNCVLPLLVTTTRQQSIRHIRGFSYIQLRKLRKSATPALYKSVKLTTLWQKAWYCDDSSPTPPKKTEISYSDLLELLDKGEVQLFDVREPKEVQETGAIPGSINVPLTKLKSAFGGESGNFEETYEAAKPSKPDNNIVFYGLCDIKGAAAVEIAHKLGYKQARHYPGGFDEWTHKHTATG